MVELKCLFLQHFVSSDKGRTPKFKMNVQFAWVLALGSSCYIVFIIWNKGGSCKFLFKLALVQWCWHTLLKIFWTISLVLNTVSQVGANTRSLSVILACSTSYTFFFSITPLEILFLFQISFITLPSWILWKQLSGYVVQSSWQIEEVQIYVLFCDDHRLEDFLVCFVFPGGGVQTRDWYFYGEKNCIYVNSFIRCRTTCFLLVFLPFYQKTKIMFWWSSKKDIKFGNKLYLEFREF